MYYSKPSEQRNRHKQKIKRKIEKNLKEQNKIKEY